jgi:hypothetical protein
MGSKLQLPSCWKHECEFKISHHVKKKKCGTTQLITERDFEWQIWNTNGKWLQYGDNDDLDQWNGEIKMTIFGTTFSFEENCWTKKKSASRRRKGQSCNLTAVIWGMRTLNLKSNPDLWQLTAQEAGWLGNRKNRQDPTLWQMTDHFKLPIVVSSLRLMTNTHYSWLFCIRCFSWNEKKTRSGGGGEIAGDLEFFPDCQSCTSQRWRIRADNGLIFLESLENVVAEQFLVESE